MHNDSKQIGKYFISPTRQYLFETVESQLFELGDKANTILMINVVPPGSKAPVHQHEEHQIGMCLSGSFTMSVDGEERVMEALKHCYWAPSGVPHGGINHSDKPAITLDIKRVPQPTDVQLTECPSNQFFLDPINPKSIKGGLDISFFVGPWFEIMYSVLAPGALMPRHEHRGIQIGVGLTGVYDMEVAGIVKPFGKDNVYFADEHVLHSGFNSYSQNASSLNIFLPPRWNLLPISKRPIKL